MFYLSIQNITGTAISVGRWSIPPGNVIGRKIDDKERDHLLRDLEKQEAAQRIKFEIVPDGATATVRAIPDITGIVNKLLDQRMPDVMALLHKRFDETLQKHLADPDFIRSISDVVLMNLPKPPESSDDIEADIDALIEGTVTAQLKSLQMPKDALHFPIEDKLLKDREWHDLHTAIRAPSPGLWHITGCGTFAGVDMESQVELVLLQDSDIRSRILVQGDDQSFFMTCLVKVEGDPIDLQLQAKAHDLNVTLSNMVFTSKQID